MSSTIDRCYLEIHSHMHVSMMKLTECQVIFDQYVRRYGNLKERLDPVGASECLLHSVLLKPIQSKKYMQYYVSNYITFHQVLCVFNSYRLFTQI